MWKDVGTALAPTVPVLTAVAGALGQMAAVAATDVLRNNLVPAIGGLAVAVATLSVPALVASTVAFATMAAAAAPLVVLAGALGLIAAVVIKFWPEITAMGALFAKTFVEGLQEVVRWTKVAIGLISLLDPKNLLAALGAGLSLPQIISSAGVGVSLFDLVEAQKKPRFGADLPPVLGTGGGGFTGPAAVSVTIGTLNAGNPAEAEAFLGQVAAAAGAGLDAAANAAPVDLLGAE